MVSENQIYFSYAAEIESHILPHAAMWRRISCSQKGAKIAAGVAARSAFTVNNIHFVDIVIQYDVNVGFQCGRSLNVDLLSSHLLYTFLEGGLKKQI